MKIFWTLALLFCLNGKAIPVPFQYGVEGLYTGEVDCPGAHSPSECGKIAALISD